MREEMTGQPLERGMVAAGIVIGLVGLLVVLAMVLQPAARPVVKPGGTLALGGVLPVGRALATYPERSQAPVALSAQAQEVMDTFATSWPELAKRQTTPEIIENLDRFHMQQGQYVSYVKTLETMAQYRRLLAGSAALFGQGGVVATMLSPQVKALGQFQPFLAWARWRLGYTDAAMRLARRAMLERPEDATAAFVYGFVVNQQQDPSPAQLVTGRNLYARVVRLDPRFKLFGATASALRRAVRVADQQQRAGRDTQPVAATRARIQGLVARAVGHAWTYRMDDAGVAEGLRLGRQLGAAFKRLENPH